MEKIDPQKAARVWQRVQGQENRDPARDLQELIVHESTDAAIYQLLAKRFQGKDRTMLQQMWQQEQAHVACLKGLYTLITGQRPVLRVQPPEQENTEQLLRLCYGRKMHCLARYEARCQDPEHGRVFEELARQEREQCRSILQLLGRW